MIPRKNNTDEMRQILTGGEVGIQWADNIGPLATFRYLASRAPIAVNVDALSFPGSVALSVVVLRAVNRSTLAIESGCRISWRPRAAGAALRAREAASEIDVTAVDVVDPSAEYDVTIGLWVA